MGLTKNSFKTEKQKILDIAEALFVKHGFVLSAEGAKEANEPISIFEATITSSGYKETETLGKFIKV